MRSGLDLRMMIRITGLATGKILPYPPDVKMPSDMMLISTNRICPAIPDPLIC